MRETIDIYGYDSLLRQAINRTKKINTSEKNIELILKFKDYCLLQRMSKGRIIRYLNVLKHTSIELNKDFDQANKEDLSKILENYDLGSYKSHKIGFNSVSNTILLINTTKGKYLLKVHENVKDSLQSLKFRINTLLRLQKHNLPIPSIQLKKDKKPISRFNGRNITIQKYISAKSPLSYTLPLLKDMAINLSQIHKALLKIPLSGKYVINSFKFKSWTKRGKQRFINKMDLYSEEKIYLKKLNSLNLSKIRKSFLHTDLNRQNIFVKQNKLICIIDWDDLREYYLPYDIATFIASNLVSSPKKIKGFIKEYQKMLPLNIEEQKASYYFIPYILLGNIGWLLMMKNKGKIKPEASVKSVNDALQRYYSFKNKLSLEKYLDFFNLSVK